MAQAVSDSSVPPGRVYFWRYTVPATHASGWHIAFDPEGLSEVLLGLQSLRPGGSSSFVTSVLPPSAAVRSEVSMAGARTWAPRRLRFAYHPSSDHWSIQDGDPEVVVTLGQDWRDRVHKWLAHSESAFDTSVGGKPQLWCWGVVDGQHPLDGDDRGRMPSNKA